MFTIEHLTSEIFETRNVGPELRFWFLSDPYVSFTRSNNSLYHVVALQDHKFEKIKPFPQNSVSRSGNLLEFSSLVNHSTSSTAQVIL